MIRGIQGIEDTGAEWYRLPSLILKRNLGMISVCGNRGLFYWKDKGHTVYLALVIDNILLTSTHVLLYNKLKNTCNT